VYMVQFLDLRGKLLIMFVSIRLMQKLGITVDVNLPFPWKLGKIIEVRYFWQKVV